MAGPVNTHFFSFASDKPGNCSERYVKHSPSFGNAFTNYFTNPSLMSSDGNNTFLGSTGLSLTTLLTPACKVCLVAIIFWHSVAFCHEYPIRWEGKETVCNHFVHQATWKSFLNRHISSIGDLSNKCCSRSAQDFHHILSNGLNVQRAPKYAYCRCVEELLLGFFSRNQYSTPA